MRLGSGGRAKSAAESGDITADIKKVTASDWRSIWFLRSLSPKWGRLSRNHGMRIFWIVRIETRIVPRIGVNHRQLLNARAGLPL
jgi:hypothetical protein